MKPRKTVDSNKRTKQNERNAQKTSSSNQRHHARALLFVTQFCKNENKKFRNSSIFARVFGNLERTHSFTNHQTKGSYLSWRLLLEWKFISGVFVLIAGQ